MTEPVLAESTPSLKAAAVTGGLWSGLQMAVNKVTSLVGTLLTMYLLAPSAFGLAAVAGSILSYVSVLPAFTLSDVLLARPSSITSILPAAIRLCALTTAVSVLMLLTVGYVCADAYGDVRIFYACSMLTIRPIAEFVMLAPQTNLRARLEFRRLSQIDAITQCAATVAAVVMAALGAGYVSLVLPQALAVLARAVCYSRLTRQAVPISPRAFGVSHPWQRLLKDYGWSGLGQYVHGGLIVAPPLVLAAYCDKETVGYFATAFALSASFNSVAAVGLGLVLQPIFAQMGGDLLRQRRAFLRTCSIIAAASMPICLCQALCVAPAFRLIMPASWQNAITIAQLLSVGQAFYFVVNPAMGILKAQGRFATFFTWQLIQLIVVIGAMVLCGSYSDSPALGIIAVYSFYHVVFSPIGLALCVPRGQGLGTALKDVFLTPMAASLTALVPLVVAVWLLPPSPMCDVLVLTLALALIALAYPPILRKFAPETHAECKDAINAVLRKIRKNK
jgi:O-antigen/teichoic acid export membrane protein